MPSDVTPPAAPSPGDVVRSWRPLRVLYVLLAGALALWTLQYAVLGSFAPAPSSPEPVFDAAAKWGGVGWRETDNGLVIIPPLGEGVVLERHPIELLIEAARQKALEKSSERPTTLQQAVVQYRKLFNADPPRSFDKWFKSFSPPPAILPKAREQFVPFLSIPGSTLRERTKRLDGVFQTFSVEFKDGEIAAVEGKMAKSGRARDILDLLRPLASAIPDIKVYFNVDDVPRQIAHHRVFNATTQYGSLGQLWPEAERAAFEDTQGGTNGYYWPCSHDSPVGRLNRDTVLAPLPGDILAGGGGSYIWDHAKAMDYCLDPQLLEEHSLFLYGHPQPDVLIPMFSYCRSAHNMDLWGVPMDAVRSDVPYVPWSEKTKARAFWKGQATGMFANKHENWRASQRHRLYRFSHPAAAKGGEGKPVSILVPSADGQGWVAQRWDAAELAEKWLDVDLVGGPMQCDKEDGTCQEMEDEIVFGRRGGPEEATKYQWVIDVDGNGWSSRFRRLLLGGSVVLKSTVYPEWYSDALIPWYHYVPLQVSYDADLFNILSFLSARPDLAREIGENGRLFALENWSWESMQAYFLLSLLEYTRALSDDRDEWTFKEGV